MNNERYNQIIDGVYKNYIQHTILGVNNGLDRITGHLDNCLVEFDGLYEHFTNPSFQYGFRPHTQEEFINKCKTDSEFSSRWELKIEERELSLEERVRIYALKEGQTYEEFVTNWNTDIQWNEDLNDANTPTKLITITYNNETIESYEY